MEFTRDDLLLMYKNMILSRKWDEKMIDSYHRSKMVTFCHSGIGEEAIGVGACTFLREDDSILWTHRGRAQCISKGILWAP